MGGASWQKEERVMEDLRFLRVCLLLGPLLSVTGQETGFQVTELCSYTSSRISVFSLAWRDKQGLVGPAMRDLCSRNVINEASASRDH